MFNGSFVALITPFENGAIDDLVVEKCAVSTAAVAQQPGLVPGGDHLGMFSRCAGVIDDEIIARISTDGDRIGSEHDSLTTTRSLDDDEVHFDPPGGPVWWGNPPE